MITHDELREEMIAQMDAGLLRPKDVQDALHLPSARVSEMRGRRRRIQQHEMPILAELLGLVEGARNQIGKIARTVQVKHLGNVAQGLWMDQSYYHDDDVEYVPFDMRPGDAVNADELFAVTPIGKSMNLRFPEGMQLICRRIPFTDNVLRSGEYVIVERRNHDLTEMTCKRMEIDGDGVFWLHSESDQPEFKEPWLIGKPDHEDHSDIEISVIGKVIRGVIDYEN